MRHLLNLRNLVATAAMTGMILIGSSAASAGHYCHAPHYYYKTVTVYETVQKPCQHLVTKYDHCGRPYTISVTTWKTVQIPVAKRIRVQY